MCVLLYHWFFSVWRIFDWQQFSMDKLKCEFIYCSGCLRVYVFFIVCLSILSCWCYCCYRHDIRFSIRFIRIRIELVILKLYWFAYHANNAFFVHNDMNATTPIETVFMFKLLEQWIVIWPFLEFDSNGMEHRGRNEWRQPVLIGDVITKNI